MQEQAQEQGVVRVRLLGPFQVWRADGTPVPAAEWRTGKTTDLLRLLALADGHPLRSEGLAGRLWPDVPPERARNSLRTATSRIRQATGSPCVTRELGGVVLRDAWVDVVEFKRLVRAAHAAAVRREHPQVLELTRRAEELHLDDFHAHDDESGWATTEREELRRSRRTMLGDAAASALELGDHVAAVDWAEAAVRVDATAEAPHRTLMQALAASGEVATALRVYETFREHLATELGADPSPQTRELHLSLLRGEPR